MSEHAVKMARPMETIESTPTVTMVATPRGPVEVATMGAGPAVLSLHGSMGGWDQGVLLARTVGPSGFRYVAPSRPGFLGTSLRVGRTPEEQGDLCAQLLDTIGVEKAAAIAVSGGGPAALHFALRHPDRCWGLVMVSAASGTIEEKPPFAWQVMKVVARLPFLVNAIRRGAQRDPKRGLERAAPDAAMRARLLANSEAFALYQELGTSMLDRMGRRIAGTQNDIDQTRCPTAWPLEALAVPTLAVHGTADSMAPYAHAKALKERARAELMTIEGGEHISIFTDREAVRSRVERFLKANAPA